MNDEEKRCFVEQALEDFSAIWDAVSDSIPQEVWNKPPADCNVINLAKERIYRDGLGLWLPELLERIMNADDEELNRMEAELKPETRAMFGLAANDGTREPLA